jgi:hypothetical protein
VHWLGATTLLAPASEEEQHRQGAPGRLNRVRSAVTQMVKVAVIKKVSVRKAFQRKTSDQLPNLGSMQSHDDTA